MRNAAGQSGRDGRSAFGCVVFLALACTEFKPGSDVESSTNPLTGGQMPASVTNTAWSCLDTAVPAASPRATVSYTVTVVDSITNEPPAGLSVRACDDIDFDCARPVTPPTGVSPDGRVRLSLAQGFDGFFEIASNTTVPTRLYPDGILSEDQDGATLELIDGETFLALASVAGVELTADTGSILARAFNCEDKLSSGVEFENDTGGLVFAFIDGLPIESDVTGAEGLVLFTNVPKGFALIQGTIVSSKRAMGSSTAESRPGWVVYADVRPGQ